MDRQTLYCVPIPGETTWVKEVRLKVKYHFLDIQIFVYCNISCCVTFLEMIKVENTFEAHQIKTPKRWDLLSGYYSL